MSELQKRIVATIVGGFIVALLVAECREVRQTHDAIIRMEAEKKIDAEKKH